MLLTSANDIRTYLCWLLYELEGSKSAGIMELTHRLKMSLN